MSLDDPQLVLREYENEERLATRRALWSGTGTDPWEVAFGAVAEIRPRRILEVGSGPGEFAQRLRCDLGAEMIATGAVTMATREDAHRYVAATLIRRRLADRLPEDGWPLLATRINCVFVAEKDAA